MKTKMVNKMKNVLKSTHVLLHAKIVYSKSHQISTPKLHAIQSYKKNILSELAKNHIPGMLCMTSISVRVRLTPLTPAMDLGRLADVRAWFIWGDEVDRLRSMAHEGIGWLRSRLATYADESTI